MTTLADKAIDPARIELGERVVRDLLGLGEDAVASPDTLRRLLASEPSIYGSKQPELPTRAEAMAEIKLCSEESAWRL